GFPTRGWQPLERGDIVLSEIVRAAGKVPMLIYDTPMLGNDSYNYTRGFAGIEFMRGQHGDRYNVDPIDPALPAAPHKLKNVTATKLYLRNTANRVYERDWMHGRTLSATFDWLERNRTRDNFVLWVDMWDPHEPFDAPAFDLERYAEPGYRGDMIIYPRYGRGDYMSAAERNHVRALYAGLVTAVDRWIGRLMEKLDTLGLDRNTLLVHLTDHGHLFGDHDLQGKPTGPYGRLYEVTNRVPLMIRHPQGLGAGRRISGLAQHPDLLPTILEFLDVKVPSGLHGRSLWPLIEGKSAMIREYAFSGRFSRGAGESPAQQAGAREAAQFDGWAGGDQIGEPITVTSEEWALVCLPGLEGWELYHLPSDPKQERNVISERPEVAKQMHTAFVDFMGAAGATEERIRLYTEPQPRLTMSKSAQLYAIRDGEGLWLAFPTEAEAAGCLVPSLPAQKVEALKFGDLVERQPRALVHIHEQYYRAEELA
ncbi:MAG TPA: sulfatase-like hydrolase/transferase, partial [Chloroflexota bacterium]|nr:sulfatase-like hydrolase/transferase [Chloroflexota bacterium]